MTARLFFLGAPHFDRDGTPAELTASKAIALLAYLAVNPRAQPRDRLLGLLWAESAEDAARKNLRNHLWTIRRALGDDSLDTHEDRLALAGSAWADVRVFAAAVESATGPVTPPGGAAEPLQAAVALYGGPLLDGLTLIDAPEFELWLTTERERLAQLNLRALTALGDLYRQAGRWADAARVAEQALRHDNLQEPAYRLLMESYARLGQRREALRQYDLLRTTLARELGVEPLPETESLRSAILSDAYTDHGAAAIVLPGAAGQVARTAHAAHVRLAGQAGGFLKPRPAAGPAPVVPFVGRQRECELLDGELAAAADGGSRIVLVTGELGIGKSRLWHEWSASLPPDPARVVLEARCLEATQALPLAPVAALLRSQPSLQRVLAADSPVPRLWLAEVARLVPEVRPLRPAGPTLHTSAGQTAAPAPPSSAEERRRLFEALMQCLLALDARPLVLFVDDAHWADSATLNWLGYLVDRLKDGPGLLLIIAYRADEAPATLARLAAGWSRQELARRLAIEQLNQEDAAALIAALRVSPLRAPVLQAQGAGNPYFLVELARSLQGMEGAAPEVWPGQTPQPGEAIPPVLAELIRVRLDRLGGPARQVLQAAAVLEPDFDYLTLHRASGRGEEEILDALDELLAAGILEEQVGTFHFTHPLVAAVVREGLSGARRAFLYRRAAGALEATYAGRLPEVAGRLAADYGLAGDSARAAHYAGLAAEQALAVSAPHEAASFYRRALAWQATPERHLGLGRTLSLVGDQAGARAEFESALAGFTAAGDRLGAARTCLAMASTYLAGGRGDEVLRWAERSLAYLDTHANPEADPQTHAESHFLLGAGRLRVGDDLHEAEAQLTEAARLAEEKGLAGVAARSRFELGTLLAQRGDLANAIAAYRASIELARANGDLWQLTLAYNNAAYHEMLAGDLTAAHADIAAGLALDEELALAPLRQYLYSTRGEIALAEGRWDEAENWFRRGQAEAERQGNRELSAGYLANLGLVARGRGDLDAALMLLEAAREPAAELTMPYLQAKIDLWLTELYELRGERTAALDALARAEGHLAEGHYGRLTARAAELGRRLRPAAQARPGRGSRQA